MSDGFASQDAHAYVDNSLSPADRLRFEAALRRDPKLCARVDAWEAQNEAIRLAFGGAAPRPRQALPLGRPSNENNAAPRPAPPRAAELQRPMRGRAFNAPRPQAPRRGWALLVIGALALAAGLVAVAGGPVDPRAALMRRADAALRAASAVADAKLDFVSDDPRAVSAWLGGRFTRIAPNRLRPPGWTLVGVRIVPGLDSAAALVLYEDAIGGRAGLMLEPTDALPPLPPAVAREGEETLLAGLAPGYAYAAAGPRRSGVGALIPARAPE
jgi:anti-sigma factor RsiW